MQVKLLRDLVEEMAGVDNGRIVDILFKKKDVNEFLIARKMELTINQVRNILYKLSAEGLVSFIRKKDKRKGWYIYYWTLKTEKCLVKLEQSLMKKIENLKGILNSRETKRFYICKPCGIEIGEEKALEHGFTCGECAEVYELSDNSRPIIDTKAKVTRTEKELALIQGELKTIREKEQKKGARENRKKAKEVEVNKLLLKTARATARKKIAEKTKKKVVKPKTPPIPRGAPSGEKKKKKIVKKKIIKPKKVVKKVVKPKTPPIPRGAPSGEKKKKKISLVGKLKKKIKKRV